MEQRSGDKYNRGETSGSGRGRGRGRVTNGGNNNQQQGQSPSGGSVGYSGRAGRGNQHDEMNNPSSAQINAQPVQRQRPVQQAWGQRAVQSRINPPREHATGKRVVQTNINPLQDRGKRAVQSNMKSLQAQPRPSRPVQSRLQASHFGEMNQQVSSVGASSSSSRPVAAPPRLPWDVFLSFRGTDTRLTFTSHLYVALTRIFIQTFMDNPELRSGEVISDKLLQAIQESKAFVVVLSENYAYSKWCLDELVAIESTGRLIIPVFYHVDPRAVRKQQGSFGKAFLQHKTKFEWYRREKWRVALESVGKISGRHIVKNTLSEADVVENIVNDILRHLNPEKLYVAKYPVGLNSGIEGITALLGSEREKVKTIGIYGMGGVGKTTLAKAVYNKNHHLFQGSCFLKNVRDASVTEEGLVRLQQQLINKVSRGKKVLVHNFDEGVNLIKARVCPAKVLIVIDDLENKESLDLLTGPFALGSRIIITTRNEDLLDSINVDVRYKVEILDDDESRQLFTKHAFGNDITTLDDLSRDVIERAGGLPLALEVFGMKLFDKPRGGWICFMDAIKQASIKGVRDILMISFKGLEYDCLRHIFLDIACLFIGRKEEEVVKMMKTCYTLVDMVPYNIGLLRKRSLLASNSRGELLAMHRQLRHMATEIVRNDSCRELEAPEKHNKLWVSKDIGDVLHKQKGTKAIEGIIPSIEGIIPAIEVVSLTTKSFTRMNNLSFLHLERASLTRNFEHSHDDLTWLCWYRCPLNCLPSSFCPQKLLVLELPHSKLRTVWELNLVLPILVKLKTLNISYSLNLTTTPDFAKLPCLETLNLEGCTSLEEVHISIGSLVGLVSLNLRGCVNLRSLSDTICNLRALEFLDIDGCSCLGALPMELWNIESLTWNIA